MFSTLPSSPCELFSSSNPTMDGILPPPPLAQVVFLQRIPPQPFVQALTRTGPILTALSVPLLRAVGRLFFISMRILCCLFLCGHVREPRASDFSMMFFGRLSSADAFLFCVMSAFPFSFFPLVRTIFGGFHQLFSCRCLIGETLSLFSVSGQSDRESLLLFGFRSGLWHGSNFLGSTLI